MGIRRRGSYGGKKRKKEKRRCVVGEKPMHGIVALSRVHRFFLRMMLYGFRRISPPKSRGTKICFASFCLLYSDYSSWSRTLGCIRTTWATGGRRRFPALS